MFMTLEHCDVTEKTIGVALEVYRVLGYLRKEPRDLLGTDTCHLLPNT